MTGALLAVSGGSAAAAAAGIGYLSDRVGYKPILLLHLSVLAASMLLHGFAQSIFQLALLRVLYGLASGGILPTMNALVGHLVPADSYGKAYGLTASMTSLGFAAGPFLGGIMASWWGYRWPFVIVSAMVVLLAVPAVLSIRPRAR